MIETERLILRGWREADKAPFHAMCSDPRVMEFLGPPMSREAVDEIFERQNNVLARTGHCFWALERRADGAFMGFCGIQPGPAGTPIEGEIEIGWRLDHPYWGQGYAHEAAQANLDWSWANLDAPAVAAITTINNARSRGLMERLGMTRCVDDDFDHPRAPEWLIPHVTYRIVRPVNRNASGAG
jgi:RimJ/RimL family protein N-acetyltransferase